MKENEIIINKYKKILSKCLDKGISLDIIEQIILTSELPYASRIVEDLLIIVDDATEYELKVAVAKEIENKNL